MLIPQAIRIGNEISLLPPRFQGSEGLLSAARGSWIGGIVAIVGMALNIIAILLVRRGKIALPIWLAIVSIISMVIVVAVFKPA